MIDVAEFYSLGYSIEIESRISMEITKEEIQDFTGVAEKIQGIKRYYPKLDRNYA